MLKHLSSDEIKNYLKRQLPPNELLRADDHLSACDECFSQVNRSSNSTDAAHLSAFFIDRDEHLSFEQLEKMVDDRCDDVEHEIAAIHLESCAECEDNLRNLIEMRALIAADLAEKQAALPPARSLLDQWRNFFSGQTVFRFGLTAAVLVIALLSLFFLFRRDKRDETASVLPNTNLPVNLENFPVNVQPNSNQTVTNNLSVPTAAPTPKPPVMPLLPAEIERVLTADRLDFPDDLQALKSQRGVLMSGGTTTIPFALQNPVGKVIFSTRPTFQWRALDGATGYRVEVYDTNFNKISESQSISATSWQIDKPLARNRIYLWQVTALKDGAEIKSPVRPAPDARFKILDAKAADEIAGLKRRQPNSHLALGVLYARAGLLAEAEREFRLELNKNPNSLQARKFLQDVRRLK